MMRREKRDRGAGGARTYATWEFAQSDIAGYQQDLLLRTTGLEQDSDWFFQFYECDIGGAHAYFGIQTPGLLIFSRFGTTDLQEIRSEPGSHTEGGTYEGPFISLRKSLGRPLGAGRYGIEVRRSSGDHRGDWFGFWVTTPEGSLEHASTFVGQMRFPRLDPQTEASIQNVGTSWTEYWPDINPQNRRAAPRVDLVFEEPVVNSGVLPTAVRLRYAAQPAADQELLTNGAVHVRAGRGVERIERPRDFERRGGIYQPTHDMTL
ncbi:MAG TPA: hypothetical protein VEJ87_14180 [Acidimicrobiales bacterium]|nr:hypothetical protein [Acidimicrobiales bacterium]